MAAIVLPTLVNLFQLDRDLHHTELALETTQRQQRRQQAKIAELQAAVAAQEAANRKLQVDQNARELDLKMRQEHIEKFRASLNITKSNKEYSAILVQISSEKADIARQETSVLELMQQIETSHKQIAGVKTQIEHEKQDLARMEAEQGEKVQALQDQIDAIRARREEAAAKVPPEPLRQYERVCQKYPGDALAPLEYDENDLESISCGSCYMGLSVENLNALRGRDELRRCNSCGRILFLPEMLGAAIQPAH
jgi:predicted  nucleic acid-binding Zn-ribbon protein